MTRSTDWSDRVVRRRIEADRRRCVEKREPSVVVNEIDGVVEVLIVGVLRRGHTRQRGGRALDLQVRRRVELILELAQVCPPDEADLQRLML